MALQLVEGPSELAVDLDIVKQHLRVEGTDKDALITLYIEAATALIDGDSYYGRALKPQTWDLILDKFPSEGIRIPLSPLIEIVNVKYLHEETGLETIVDPDDYEVDVSSNPGWVVPLSGVDWPSTMDAINAVRVRFKSGYPDTTDSPPASTIPRNIQLAILYMVGDSFAFRETAVTGTISAPITVTATVKDLLHKERIFL